MKKNNEKIKEKVLKRFSKSLLEDNIEYNEKTKEVLLKTIDLTIQEVSKAIFDDIEKDNFLILRLKRFQYRKNAILKLKKKWDKKWRRLNDYKNNDYEIQSKNWVWDT